MILMYDSVLSVSLARRQPVEPLRMHGQIQTHANVMQNDTISFLHFHSFKKFPGLGGSGAGGVGNWTKGRAWALSQLLANCIPSSSSNSKPHFSPLIWPGHRVIDICMMLQLSAR